MNGKKDEKSENLIDICKDHNQKSKSIDLDSVFTAEKIEALTNEIRKELKSGSLSDTEKKTESGTKKIPDTTKKEKRGRKNRGLTKLHRQDRNEYRRTLTNLKNSESFNNEIIECVDGKIVDDSEIKQFKELYHLTCEAVLDKFRSDNPTLTEKHPYMWYKKLLIELKKNVPKVTYKELDKLIVVWDCLTWLMSEIGLYITFETFSLFTCVYQYQLEKMEGVNPKYADFRKKILIERDNALVNEISYNPYNSTNKIFLAKVHGIIEKTEPKQIEVVHTVRDYHTLPMFENTEN